jgi:hypothetical protein
VASRPPAPLGIDAGRATRDLYREILHDEPDPDDLTLPAFETAGVA